MTQQEFLLAQIAPSRAKSFLMLQGAKSNSPLSQTVKSSLKNPNEVKIVNFYGSHRKDIKGLSSIATLLKTDQKEIQGESFFDGNKLPAGRNLCIDRLRFAYHTSATDSGNTLKSVRYSSLFDNMPIQILNAELKLKLEDKVIFSSLIEPMTMNEKPRGLRGKGDMMELENPIIIPEQTNYAIELHFADGHVMSNDVFHFASIDFAGVEISSK